jgi:RND family efflux transporter MFP subunit
MNVVSLRTVYFEADVSETQLAKVKPGQTANVKVDAYPDMTFIGKIARINPAAQSGTRNFRVRVNIPNPGNELRPGMFARGAIIAGGTSGAILIPQDAVEERNGQHIVFTVEKVKNESRVKLHTINRGLTNAQFVELNPPTDIRAGDTVVTSGHEKLQDNDKVHTGH